MRRLRNSLLLVLLAGICLSQTPNPVQLLTPAVRRVGERLACKCGACNNTVGNCPMIECHYALPAREKIRTMQAQGASDDVIVAAFVQERGLSALSAPPKEGFSLLSWVMPFVAIALGLGLIWLYVKRFRKPVPATVPPTADPRYRERIEKDLSEFD